MTNDAVVVFDCDCCVMTTSRRLCHDTPSDSSGWFYGLLPALAGSDKKAKEGQHECDPQQQKQKHASQSRTKGQGGNNHHHPPSTRANQPNDATLPTTTRFQQVDVSDGTSYRSGHFPCTLTLFPGVSVLSTRPTNNTKQTHKERLLMIVAEATCRYPQGWNKGSFSEPSAYVILAFIDIPCCGIQTYNTFNKKGPCRLHK